MRPTFCRGGQLSSEPSQRVQAAGLLPRNTDLETLADMLSSALMYHLLMLPADENPVGELRKQMARLLRQAGFEIPEWLRGPVGLPPTD